MRDLHRPLNTLKRVGWKVTLKAERSLALSDHIKSRHTKLPEDYTDFLCYVAQCVNADETAWFLCESDFNGESDSALAWNDLEMQSVEAAEGDDDLTKSIQHFWRRHLPIAFSVKTGYAYLALDLSSDNHSSIVYGREPEYEDAEGICDSFSDLIKLINSTANGREVVPSLASFI